MQASFFKDSVFRAVAAERPIATAVQMVLRRMLSPMVLDRLFYEHAKSQYFRSLLFSSPARLICGVVLSKHASVNAGYKKMKEPRVLFVCVENANRSQMAQAFAVVLGGGVVEALSAGSRPSGIVNPRSIEFMREVGYELATHDSKSLDAFAGHEIDVAVTMGCGDACPLVKAQRREAWDIPDPKHMSDEEFRGVRDLIRSKVETLLASLRRH